MDKETGSDDGIVPTLEDVAAEAGVSTATVSRCLNAPDRVSEETRLRVMRAVSDLGYTPNFGARALAAKRTNTFGAIIPTMENSIFARGLQSFQEELGRNGITLLVASSGYRTDLEEEQIRALVARGADALLLIGYDRTPETYDFLRRRKIPFLLTWAFEEGSRWPSIGFDNRKAMKALTAEVIGLGHTELGLISAERHGNDRARMRCNGAVDAVREARLPDRSLRIVETPYSISNGAAAFAELMRAPRRPTAVLCGNDVLGAGALSMAAKMGLRVPQDVSVTGFDDIEIAEIVTPGLTTVHVPHREMGARAAKMLLALRNGEDPDPAVELAAEVKWRESLGPARRR